MPRLKLVIEYDGTPFVGWQLQAGGPSVQGLIAEAIAAFSGERVAVFGAGRTDAGVHALGQVAHFDLTRDWRADRVRDALNARLRPQLIAVLSAEKVDAGFDARFSAKRRHYLYRIINRRADLALERNRRSCTIRCARWWARWCWWARANGARNILPPRSPRARAAPAAPSPRPRACIWSAWSIDGSAGSAFYLPARGGKGGLPAAV